VRSDDGCEGEGYLGPLEHGESRICMLYPHNQRAKVIHILRCPRDIDGATILMKSKILAVAALAVVFAAAVDPAAGQTVLCGGMKADLSQLQDGALFYRPHLAPRTVGWTQLATDPSIDSKRPTEVDFIYVARENWLPQGRPGMLVIKSGRMLGADPAPPGPEMVGLRRIEPARPYPRPECPRKYVFKSSSFEGQVRGESYDRYHDSVSRIPWAEKSVIEGGLHSAYVGRRDQCKESNDLTSDSFGGRSNRGQFSFTTGVVVAQFKSRLIAALGVSPSFAGAFSNRNVEVRRYQTDENRIACVAFTLTVAQPNFFVRINDLERVTGSEQFPVRGDESQWNMSR
jgi:hypothetical protein